MLAAGHWQPPGPGGHSGASLLIVLRAPAAGISITVGPATPPCAQAHTHRRQMQSSAHGSSQNTSSQNDLQRPQLPAGSHRRSAGIPPTVSPPPVKPDRRQAACRVSSLPAAASRAQPALGTQNPPVATWPCARPAGAMAPGLSILHETLNGNRYPTQPCMPDIKALSRQLLGRWSVSIHSFPHPSGPHAGLNKPEILPFRLSGSPSVPCSRRRKL